MHKKCIKYVEIDLQQFSTIDENLHEFIYTSYILLKIFIHTALINLKHISVKKSVIKYTTHFQQLSYTDSYVSSYLRSPTHEFIYILQSSLSILKKSSGKKCVTYVQFKHIDITACEFYFSATSKMFRIYTHHLIC